MLAMCRGLGFEVDRIEGVGEIVSVQLPLAAKLPP